MRHKNPSDFTNELNKFLSNSYNLVKAATPELSELFNTATNYLANNKDLQNVVPGISEEELHFLFELLKKEMAFFNKNYGNNEEDFKKHKKKLLEASIIILASLSKFFSNWVIEILQEILTLAKIFMSKK